MKDNKMIVDDFMENLREAEKILKESETPISKKG